MLKILLLAFLTLIKAQDDYETLINETVTEEHCNNVISNLTTVLNEVYVFTDYLKGPIQQKGFQVYDDQVDLLAELNILCYRGNTKQLSFFLRYILCSF